MKVHHPHHVGHAAAAAAAAAHHHHQAAAAAHAAAAVSGHHHHHHQAAAAAAVGYPPGAAAASAAAAQLMDMYTAGMSPATAINTMDWKNTSQVRNRQRERGRASGAETQSQRRCPSSLVSDRERRA